MSRPLNLTYRPIIAWPGKMTPDYQRRQSPFADDYSSALAKLGRELPHLHARLVVVQLAVAESQIRRDGGVYANVTPTQPGVILSFESQHGPLCIWTDALRHWKANLRAIADHLEHLRLAGIYGVGKGAQQYRGWTQLPPPVAEPKPFSNPFEAAVYILSDGSGTPPHAESIQRVLAHPDSYRCAYWAAAKRHHPDAGGTTAGFQRLQQAKDVLDRHHHL